MNKHEYKRDHNETLIREGRNTIVSFSHPDEHHVIAEVHQEAVGAGSGVPVEMTLYYLFEIRNGRAVRLHMYPDREAALCAVR